jgi:hypothetical protein
MGIKEKGKMKEKIENHLRKLGISQWRWTWRWLHSCLMVSV